MMRSFLSGIFLTGAFALMAQPTLPYKVVEGWGKLPPGWNLGECSGVAVDKNDNVWVFNRGKHPVVEFDREGKMLRAWEEVPVAASHGIRVDSEGFVWLIDVAGHQVLKMTPEGRLVFRIGGVTAAPSTSNDDKELFNRPTSVAFAPNGDFFVSDGYVNSRVVRYNKNAEYMLHWGTKGTGDGQFNLVHDVALDEKGRVYVADRNNQRVQIFDQSGKFLTKWTNTGSAWGLIYSERDKALFVGDGDRDRILRLNLEGQITGVLGSHGKMPGQFDFIHHMAMDSKGAIYTAEVKNWRVQKFVPR